MHFCSQCHNMYYIRLSANVVGSAGDEAEDIDDKEESMQEDRLVYYCRNCGNEDSTITVDNVCISKVNFKKGEQNFNNIINEYTKLDPTLPRINNIPCPNTECASHNDKTENDIVYLRYDETNMKYVYLCANCDTVWRLDQEM